MADDAERHVLEGGDELEVLVGGRAGDLRQEILGMEVRKRMMKRFEENKRRG